MKDKVKTRKKLMAEIHEEEYRRCEVCKQVTDAYHVHHIVSRGAGGDECYENYAILDYKCHYMIHNSPMQFIKKYGQAKYDKYIGR